MKIMTQCPFCNQSFELEQEAIDRRIRCPKCRLLFKIPHKDKLGKALGKIADAKTSVYIDPKGNTYA